MRHCTVLGFSPFAQAQLLLLDQSWSGLNKHCTCCILQSVNSGWVSKEQKHPNVVVYSVITGLKQMERAWYWRILRWRRTCWCGPTNCYVAMAEIEWVLKILSLICTCKWCAPEILLWLFSACIFGDSYPLSKAGTWGHCCFHLCFLSLP